MNTGYQRH